MRGMNGAGHRRREGAATTEVLRRRFTGIASAARRAVTAPDSVDLVGAAERELRASRLDASAVPVIRRRPALVSRTLAFVRATPVNGERRHDPLDPTGVSGTSLASVSR